MEKSSRFQQDQENRNNCAEGKRKWFLQSKIDEVYKNIGNVIYSRKTLPIRSGKRSQSCSMSANKQSDIALKNSSEREKYFVGVQPNPANGLYQSNYIQCYFKTTRKELRCLVSAISANSATCLPHIVTKNHLKLLKATRNQALKSGYFSAVFAQYSKLAEAFRSVQSPYPSPQAEPAWPQSRWRSQASSPCL